MAIKYLVYRDTQRWNYNYKYAKWNTVTNKMWVVTNDDEEIEIGPVVVMILDCLKNTDLYEEIEIVERDKLLYNNSDFYMI